jgi:hypothetical protein
MTRRAKDRTGTRLEPQPVTWQVTEAAVALITALAGLTLFPIHVALACCAAIVGLVAWRLHRRRWVLGTGALALAAAALVTAISAHDTQPPIQWQWDRMATDLASASEPVGFFPARPALVCTTGACGTGQRLLLNSLIFGNGGFPQGVRDERRFLTARIVPELPVYATTDLSVMHDPLRVAPGDEIEVAGIVDNAGDSSRSSTTARDLRVLLALPTGAGKSHAILSSVSAPNADRTAVSDSVVITSSMPTYLRYKPGSAIVVGQGSVHYRLPEEFLAFYDAARLDRRALAGHGAPIGCSRPDGILPAGRRCAMRFEARFDVRYAASSIDINGIGGITQGFSEVSGTVRGHGQVPLYWAPHRSAFSYLTVPSGRDVSIDCVLYTGTSTWYHVADAARLRDGPMYGYDTAFIPARNIIDVCNFPTDCISQ